MSKKPQFKDSRVKFPAPCKECNNNYEFTHLQFNFSFLTKNNKFGIDSLDAKKKSMLVDRVFQLSEPNYIDLMLWRKNIGYESMSEEELRVPSFHPDFTKDDFRSQKGYKEKYTIFRLDPNNTQSDCRIIGKILDKVFYVMFFSHNHSHLK